jgi:GrpB-like predicted nucleotidyltransferase (UPF0157 family)
VLVVPYDPAWPEAAAAEIAALAPLFPRIEHFGSTSVPGLAAKPVIDLMAAVPVVREVPVRGYRVVDTGMTGRLFYQRDGYHLHVVSETFWPASNERILRDYLRGHPREAARYAELKLGLAAAGLTGERYTRAKTGLIQELVDAARIRLGLPLVPVWED